VEFDKSSKEITLKEIVKVAVNHFGEDVYKTEKIRVPGWSDISLNINK
jgi:hypothetical protein